MAAADPQIDNNDVHLLAELFYADLQRIAHGERQRNRCRPETLHTTALVHEAYLKLSRQPRFRGRGHFLATAALAMRQVLVSRARQRLTEKRGAGAAALPLEVAEQLGDQADDRMLALDEALARLEASHPRLARVVECRWFAGYDEAETASALEVTVRTVQRDWVKAKALLYEALGT